MEHLLFFAGSWISLLEDSLYWMVCRKPIIRSRTSRLVSLVVKKQNRKQVRLLQEKEGSETSCLVLSSLNCVEDAPGRQSFLSSKFRNTSFFSHTSSHALPFPCYPRSFLSDSLWDSSIPLFLHIPAPFPRYPLLRRIRWYVFAERSVNDYLLMDILESKFFYVIIIWSII